MKIQGVELSNLGLGSMPSTKVTKALTSLTNSSAGRLSSRGLETFAFFARACASSGGWASPCCCTDFRTADLRAGAELGCPREPGLEVGTEARSTL